MKKKIIRFLNKMGDTPLNSSSQLQSQKSTPSKMQSPKSLESLDSMIEESIKPNIDQKLKDTSTSNVIEVIYDTVTEIQNFQDQTKMVDEIFKKLIDIYKVAIISQIESEIQDKVNTKDIDIQSAIDEVLSKYPYLQSKSSDTFRKDLDIALIQLRLKLTINDISDSVDVYKLTDDIKNQIDTERTNPNTQFFPLSQSIQALIVDKVKTAKQNYNLSDDSVALILNKLKHDYFQEIFYEVHDKVDEMVRNDDCFFGADGKPAENTYLDKIKIALNVYPDLELQNYLTGRLLIENVDEDLEKKFLKLPKRTNDL